MEFPCGTASVTAIACCLLNTTSEEGKTQENKAFTVFALIAIRRHIGIIKIFLKVLDYTN